MLHATPTTCTCTCVYFYLILGVVLHYATYNKGDTTTPETQQQIQEIQQKH